MTEDETATTKNSQDPPLRLGFLASNSGSNMLSILKACQTNELFAKPAIVISHNKNAVALKKAKEFNIPSAICNSDTEVLKNLQKHQVNLICLVGYLRMVSKELINAYPKRILNIHPSLLPMYGGKGFYGKKVHQAVLDDKVKITGATVHLINEKYDSGNVLGQIEVTVLENDSVDSLQTRVFSAEEILYLQVLKKFTDGDI